MRLAIVVGLVPAAIAADGLLLLGELGCVRCHRAGAGLDPRSGPVLTGAGSRLTFAHIRGVVSGAIPSSMPSFPALSAAGADALSRLIASSRTALPASPPGSAPRGKQIYGRVGCAACHGITTPPLVSKYLPGALAAFLLDPLATHPSARMPRLPLSPADAADLEAFLSPSAQPATVAPPPPESATALFATAGCAHCHTLAIGSQTIRAETTPPPLAALTRLDRGCLDPSTRSTPRYSLTPVQRAALREAIRQSAEISASRRLALRLAALNCLQCHARDGAGGPSPANRDAFTVLADTGLGDEGRFPPPLTAAGYKLTPQALRDAIQGRTSVHPAMATRMPDYGPHVAGQLEALFTALDMPAGFQPVERTGRNTFGRELVGVNGLGCIGCHNLRGRKSLGIGASDLALVPRRVRVEWLRDFLIDPARFHPGTRMPSFWPGGRSTRTTVLGGNTVRQIDSIYVYLMEIDQTRLPAGMEEKGAYELKPSDKAIVLRAFMKDAGAHAVAVGLPGQVNAAFDTNEVRWALLWRGRFVDAESVWEDRFNPPMVPLGENVVRLPSGPAFRTPSGKCDFRGYRLGERGIPSFLYECGGARVIDTIVPAAGGSLNRLVQVDAPNPVVCRLAPAGPALRINVHGATAVERDGEFVADLPPGKHALRVEIAW